MYEDKTFEALLREKLALVPADLDKREGSIIYDAMAPNAVESALIYIALEEILNETFADTASFGSLVKRCAERGIVPYKATAAIGIGLFNMDVPLGSRFSCDKYNWRVTEQIAVNKFYLTCETLGNDPNRYTGTLIPIDYIDGLTRATLTEIAINGEDEEATDALRMRYMASLNNQPYGFNRAQYIEITGALPGVGGVKPYRAWDGPGTVKLVITDSNYGVPSAALIDAVQTVIDPSQSHGEGLGLASIDHEVTVRGVTFTVIDIAATLTYATGWSFDECLPYIKASIDSYFHELNRTWADNTALIIRIAQIETRLLSVPGIIDITGTVLNGAAINMELDGDAIAVQGVFTDG